MDEVAVARFGGGNDRRRDIWMTTKELLKIIGYAFIALVFLYASGFLATGGDLAIYRFWAPKMEDARREVFEQTQSYVQGKNTYISRLRLQYESTSGNQRESLRRLILSEAETIDDSNLTPANLAFVNEIRRMK
jgi:hypothetical protein